MAHQRGNPDFCRSRPPNAVLGDYSRAAAVRHADFRLTDSAAGILISVAEFSAGLGRPSHAGYRSNTLSNTSACDLGWHLNLAIPPRFYAYGREA